MNKEKFVEKMQEKIEKNNNIEALFELYAKQSEYYYNPEIEVDRAELHRIGMQMVIDFVKEHYTEKK